MKHKYTPTDLYKSRLTRFERFHASLDDEDRACLDTKLNRWLREIKRRAPNVPFSLTNAKELFMALIEMEGFIQEG